MLASLLPGLREIRAPLAAGYIWLVVGWLALNDIVPDNVEKRAGLIGDLYELADWMGRPALGVALSFVAYILGVLSLMLVTVKVSKTSWTAPSASGRAMLREVVIDALIDRAKREPEITTASDSLMTHSTSPEQRRTSAALAVEIESLVDEFVADLPLMPKRLLGDERERELNSEYDRIRSEGEFRLAIAFPIYALFGVLGLTVSLWWLLGSVVGFLLLADARGRWRASYDLLAEAVRARTPASPAMTKVASEPLPMRDHQSMLMQAAARGYPEAEFRLAELYELDGKDKRANELYQRAARAGHGPAMLKAADDLTSEAKGIEPDAVRMYMKQALEGDSLAISRLRGMTEEHPHLKLNLAELFRRTNQYDEALAWLTEAASEGTVQAMVELARMLERDAPENAAQWWAEAAAQGHPEALRHEAVTRYDPKSPSAPNTASRLLDA